MEKLITIVAFVIFTVLLALGVFWATWSVYCYVLGSIWPTGPQAIVSPGFWLFVATWFLLGVIGRALFGAGRVA